MAEITRARGVTQQGFVFRKVEGETEERYLLKREDVPSRTQFDRETAMRLLREADLAPATFISEIPVLGTESRIRDALDFGNISTSLWLGDTGRHIGVNVSNSYKYYVIGPNGKLKEIGDPVDSDIGRHGILKPGFNPEEIVHIWAPTKDGFLKLFVRHGTPNWRFDLWSADMPDHPANMVYGKVGEWPGKAPRKAPVVVSNEQIGRLWSNNKSPKEIAEQLNVSESTVRKRLNDLGLELVRH